MIDLDFFTKLLEHSFSSLYRVVIGVAIGLFLSYIFSFIRFAIEQNTSRHFFFSFIFDSFKFVPPIAWVPLIILTVGLNFWAPVCVVVIAATSILFSLIYDHLVEIKMEQAYALRKMNPSLGQLYRTILFRGSLTRLFLHLKSAFSLSWMSIIAAEMIGGSSGLGYAIQESRLYLEYGHLLIYIFCIGFLGFVISHLLQTFHDKLNA